MATKTIKGLGSLKKVPVLLEKLEMRKPMLVGSPVLLEKLRSTVPTLRNAPAFSGYHPNPDLTDCEVGVRLYRESHCDSLISIGGGSAMDTAKGIKAYLLAENAEAVCRNALRPGRIPHLAIPATAGTGSEATQFAVMYLEGKKLSLNHPLLLPEGVLLDGELLATLPLYQKKACAMDALAQGIESWWSKSSTEDSEVHAFLAISGVLSNLRFYIDETLKTGRPRIETVDPSESRHCTEEPPPDRDTGVAVKNLRLDQEMLEAAWQSGLAIQITRTTAAHAMSYQLTKRFGFAHGHACMLTLPVLWEDMIRVAEMKPVLRSLAAAMRLKNPEDGPDLLRGILCDLDLIPDLTLSEEILENLASSVNVERLGNHPVSMTTDELKSVYRRALKPILEKDRKKLAETWHRYAGEIAPGKDC